MEVNSGFSYLLIANRAVDYKKRSKSNTSEICNSIACSFLLILMMLQLHIMKFTDINVLVPLSNSEWTTDISNDFQSCLRSLKSNLIRLKNETQWTQRAIKSSLMRQNQFKMADCTLPQLIENIFVVIRETKTLDYGLTHNFKRVLKWDLSFVKLIPKSSSFFWVFPFFPKRANEVRPGDFFGVNSSMIDISSLSELSLWTLERFIFFFFSTGDHLSLLDDFSDALESLRCRFWDGFAVRDGVVLSWEVRMKEVVLCNCYNSRLSTLVMQLLFSFDQDMRGEKTLIQTLASQLSYNSCSRLIRTWKSRELPYKLSLLNFHSHTNSRFSTLINSHAIPLFSFDQDMRVEKTLIQTFACQLSSTLVQPLSSFDQDLRVEKTLIQTLAFQLLLTLVQLLFSFDQDMRVEKTLIQTLACQLLCNPYPRLTRTWELRKLSYKLLLFNYC